MFYPSPFAAAMIDFIAARARLIKELSSEIVDKRVLAAMSRIPREKFIPPEYRHAAYEDRPLPIGFEQTISQPYIIALMTQALALNGTEKVLELGTGSGYQTAILAGLARQVISVERHPAGETLGWPEGAPYDAIMVTAGAPKIPDELLAQLGSGGRMVIPVGSRFVQELCKVTRSPAGNVVEDLGGCRFVSLIGKSAWDD